MLKLLENNLLVFTKSGLDEFVELIKSRHTNYFRNRKVPLHPEAMRKPLLTDKFKFNFDPNLPLVFHTPVLKGSVDKIIRHIENPNEIAERVYTERDLAEKEKLRKKEEEKKKRQEALYDDESIILKKRLQAKKEKRLKLLKEENKMKLQKKKQLAAAAAERAEQSNKGKKK